MMVCQSVGSKEIFLASLMVAMMDTRRVDCSVGNWVEMLAASTAETMVDYTDATKASILVAVLVVC